MQRKIIYFIVFFLAQSSLATRISVGKLFHAVEQNSSRAFARLPQAGEGISRHQINFSPRAPKRGGNTPLHVAVLRNADFSVTWLLNHGADANKLNANLETPVHIAFRKGYNKIAQTFIKVAQYNIVQGDSKGRWAIELAVINNHSFIVEEFLKEENIEPIVKMKLIDAALAHGAHDSLKVLTSEENNYGYAKHLLEKALNRRENDKIITLFKAGFLYVPKSKYHWSLLHHAVFWQDLSLVKRLVRARFPTKIKDAKGKGWTAYGLAKYFGHQEIAEYLLEQN